MDKLGRESIRRNPLIADLLHRIEFIEKAGTGIRRIRDEAREQGCPEPEFKIRGAFFVVVFPARSRGAGTRRSSHRGSYPPSHPPSYPP